MKDNFHLVSKCIVTVCTLIKVPWNVSVLFLSVVSFVAFSAPSLQDDRNKILSRVKESDITSNITKYETTVE